MLGLRGCLAIALATVLAGSSFGQVTRSGKGYLFRAHYVRGEIQKFSTLMVVPAADGKHQAIGTAIKLKVLQVKNGQATVDISLGSATEVTTQKKERPISFPKHNRLKLDKLNHSVNTNDGANVLVMFPPRAVQMNTMWTAFSTFPLGKGGATLQTTYKLAGIQTKDHKKIAVLDVQLHGFANGNGSMLVDMADGSLLASLLTIQITAGDDSSTIQLRVRRDDDSR